MAYQLFSGKFTEAVHGSAKKFPNNNYPLFYALRAMATSIGKRGHPSQVKPLHPAFPLRRSCAIVRLQEGEFIMRLGLMGCALIVVLAGGQSAAVAQTEPTAEVAGVAQQLKDMLAKTPYAAPAPEICAMATAILTRAAQAEPEPAWPRVGTVDCGQSFATAGFDVWTDGSDRTFRRVDPPGQLQDGMIIAGIDYGCTTSMCLGWVSYTMVKNDGVWIAGDEVVSGIR